MGEKLNRAMQRHLLTMLSDSYPKQHDVQSIQGDSAAMVNLAYLEEHGLVWLRMSKQLDAWGMPSHAKITAKGLDFLQDDGGLGAILGVVTVKLHEDTIKQMLVSKIEASEADPGVKEQLVAKVKGLPAEALSGLAGKLMEKGVENAGNIVTFLAGLL
jgi:hypothetical protein